VLREHQAVVHLVDVVAGQHHQVFRAVALDDVPVLVYGIGCSEVPLGFRDALAGRQDVEALVALGPQEVPAALQMTDQAVRLVLGGDTDVPDAGIERIGEREVDDARFAAEIDRRLGASVRELEQARAAPTGKNIRHGRAGKLAGSGLPLD